MKQNSVFMTCLLTGMLGIPSTTFASHIEEMSKSIKENAEVMDVQTVTAKVTDASGTGLPGVSVHVKGKTTGTITDANGNFQLKVSQGDILTFSYIGFAEQDIPVDQVQGQVTLKESSRTLGEVIVTTQKRAQSSLEIPTAVSAVTGNMLGELNLNQMNQVADFIPGVQIQQQSPNNGGYSIRGVTSDDGAATSQPRVSVFLDGVSNFRTQSSQVELFDMDRVEVVKGPQGTLFGRGAEIGAINLIRKRPENKLSGEISLNYGTYNQRGISGFLNTPIKKDKVLNRFAFSYDAHDGFIKNMAGGRLNGKNSIAVRNSTRFFAGDRTTMDLVLDYQHDDYPGTSFKSNQITPQNNYAAGVDPNFDANSPADLEEGKWLGIKRHIGGMMFNVSHDMNDNWKFTSLTGVRAYKSDENFDADGTRLPLLKCTENAKGWQASQEFRFNFSNKGPLSGFIGTSYFFEHAQQGATLEGNMQYFYPAVIVPQIKEKVNAALPELTGGKINNMNEVYAAIKGFDFTTLESALGGMVQGNPALAAQLKAYLTGLNQQKDNMVKQISGLVNSWLPTDPNTPVANYPNIYGDIDNIIKAYTKPLAGLPQFQGQAPGLDQLLQLVGGSSSNNETINKLMEAMQGIKDLSGKPLPTSHKEDMTNYAENHAVDIFADATWHIYKGLSATLGLRGTFEHQRSGYSSTSQTDIPELLSSTGTILYHPTPGGKTVWADKNYVSYVGRFALNYMFNRNNVYFNISRGRRPGVIAFNNDPEKITRLKPEIIWSYELGIKGNIQNKLFYDLCGYYYDWYNFQSSNLTNNTEDIGKTDLAMDAGRARSLGVEASLKYAFCQYFNLFANYSYIDAKFKDTDEHGNKQAYAGNTFRLTPKNSFAVGFNLNIPTSESAAFYFTPTYSWKSKMFFEDDNNPLLTQKAYGLLNFTAGYHFLVKNIRYEIGAFGRNILDQKYIIDAGNSGRQIGYPTFVGGTRSIIGLQFKLNF